MYSYSWQDLINVGSRYGKGIPLSKVDAQICDFVSSEMYLDYPWKDSITNTASGAIPLIDSVQDYTAAAPNIYRLLKAWIVRTDVTPQETRDLDVMKDLSVDLYSRSYLGIRCVSLQQSQGIFRLEAAVNVPTGVQLELRCDYQIEVIRVTSLSLPCWFRDVYAMAAIQGLLYWVYKLSDDTRAGGVTCDAFGRTTGYTGQYGAFRAAINQAKEAEDFGFTESVVPAEPMGLPRDSNSLNIFGW